MKKKSFSLLLVLTLLFPMLFLLNSEDLHAAEALTISISKNGTVASQTGDFRTVYAKPGDKISVTYTIDPNVLRDPTKTMMGYATGINTKAIYIGTSSTVPYAPDSVSPQVQTNASTYGTGYQDMTELATSADADFLTPKSITFNVTVPNNFSQLNFEISTGVKWESGTPKVSSAVIYIKPYGEAYIHYVEENDWNQNGTAAQDIIDSVYFIGADTTRIFGNSSEPDLSKDPDAYIETIDGYTYVSNNTADFVNKDGFIVFDADLVKPFYYVYHQKVGNIDITKQDDQFPTDPMTGEVAGPKELLSGAIFEIINELGEVVRTTGETVYGKVLVENLPLGKYTIHEITPPTDYTNPIDVQIELTEEGATVPVTIENAKVTGNVYVVHQLVDDSFQYVSDILKETLIENERKDTPYIASILDPANYPDFEYVGMKWDETDPDIGYVKEDDQTVIFQYRLTPASMDVVASVEGAPDQYVEGVTFDLYDEAGNLLALDVTQEGLPVLIEGLPRAKYYIRNIVLPANYYLVSDAEIEIDLSYMDGTKYEFVNIVMAPELGTIHVSSVLDLDQTTKVAGVTFDIYTEDGQLLISEVSFADIATVLQGLPLQKYTLKNIKVPEGYILASDAEMIIDLTVAKDYTVDALILLRKVGDPTPTPTPPSNPTRTGENLTVTLLSVVGIASLLAAAILIRKRIVEKDNATKDDNKKE